MRCGVIYSHSHSRRTMWMRDAHDGNTTLELDHRELSTMGGHCYTAVPRRARVRLLRLAARPPSSV